MLMKCTENTTSLQNGRYKNEILCDTAILYNIYIYSFCINAYPYIRSTVDFMLCCPIQNLNLAPLTEGTRSMNRGHGQT